MGDRQQSIEKIQAELGHAELFASAPIDELRAVARQVRSLDLQAGESAVVRGQPLLGMFLVEEGAVEVMLEATPICTLSPGSIFCEDALVTDAPAPATLRAVSATRLGVLERDGLSKELARLPALHAAIEQAWRRRVLAAGLFPIDYIQALSPEARARLLEQFERVEIPAGTVLARDGELLDCLYFFRAGEAELILGPSAEERAALRAGDYLGDTGLLDDAPQTATVHAATGLTAMRLTRAGFQAALAALPGQLDAAKAAYAQRNESFF